MTWLTVVNVFALIGAGFVVVVAAVGGLWLLFTKNEDAFNRHSSPR